MRQADDGYVEPCASGLCRLVGALIQRDRVFGRHIDILEKRNDPQDRNARPPFQPSQTRFQKSDIAAKLVDDETPDKFSLLASQEHESSEQRGKHASTVDVSHEQ